MRDEIRASLRIDLLTDGETFIGTGEAFLLGEGRCPDPIGGRLEATPDKLADVLEEAFRVYGRALAEMALGAPTAEEAVKRAAEAGGG